MKKLLHRARALRRDMTDAEQRLWYRLRRKQICNARFRGQHPIGNYIVDFVCLDRKLVIEVDGGQHQDSGYDDKRDAWLRAHGFHVLRFWNHDVLQQTDEVVESIWRWLK